MGESDVHELTERSRALRNNPTEPEIRLWGALRASQLGGHKFRRQSAIGLYVVDFMCPSKALVVEVDGDTHDAGHDRRRDSFLLEQGFRTIRFSNADVMRNLDGVLQTILSALGAQPDRWCSLTSRPHPNPSPEGEGL